MDDTTKARMDRILEDAKKREEDKRNSAATQLSAQQQFEASFWTKVDGALIRTLTELTDYLNTHGMKAELLDNRNGTDKLAHKGVYLKFKRAENSGGRNENAIFSLVPDVAQVRWECSVPHGGTTLRSGEHISINEVEPAFIERQVTEALNQYLKP